MVASGSLNILSDANIIIVASSAAEAGAQGHLDSLSTQNFKLVRIRGRNEESA